MFEKIKQEKIKWWNEKDVLITGVLVGILSHMYMMTNKLPNIDDYISIFHYGAGYTSGRWLLALLGNFSFRIDGTYSMPFFNGSIYILALALAIMIFLMPFSFRSRWTKRIFSGLFVAFPTVTATMGFMFTAPFYGVAVLLMAIAFYALVTYKYGFLIAIMFICLSLGIYQAYWGLTAGFLLLYLMMLCMDRESKIRDIIVLTVKSFIALLMGVVLYFTINKVMLNIQGVQLTDYQGISEMGRFDISKIPEILKSAYGWFFRLVKENYLHITWYPFVRLVIAIGYVLTIIGFLMVLVYNRTQILKNAMLLIFTIVFPLAVNSIYMISYDATFVHVLMCYSVVLVFFIPFVFMNGVSRLRTKNMITSAIKYGYMLLVMVVVVFYMRFANIYYLNLELAFCETFSFMETLSTRIQEADNYSEDKPIYFYGMYQKSVNKNIWEMRMVNNMVGAVDVANVINSPLMRQAYSRIYLGNAFYELADGTKMEKYAPQIEEMPSYPNDGSIVVVEDTVIVKFSDME